MAKVRKLPKVANYWQKMAKVVTRCQKMPDMIFVKNFTRPEFLGPRFYPKKCVNRDNDKFTTKQRKFFKLLNLRQNSVMLQYNILANIQLSQETLGQLKISQDE